MYSRPLDTRTWLPIPTAPALQGDPKKRTLYLHMVPADKTPFQKAIQKPYR